MKKVITVVLAAMMIFCGLHVVVAEETIEVATSEEEIIEQEVAEAPAEEAPAAEEPVAEEPAAEEPAPEPAAPEAPAADPAPEAPAAEPVKEAAPEAPAEKPAEPAPEAPAAEPVKEPAKEAAPEAPAEKTAEPAPAAEPVKEAAKEAVPEEPAEKPAEAAPAAEPVQEPAQEAPVAEPAPAAPAAEPVKETVAEEPAAVETEEAPAAEEAPASFTGTLAVRYSQNPVEIGTTTFFRAAVHNENMAYTLQWELETETGWTAISGANAAVYTFTVTEPAGTYNYRVVLTAEDGTVLTAEVALTVVEPETEEPTAEIPAEEELEAEEPAEEIPAEEETVAEEPAEEVPAEEQTEAEEPVAEEETDESGLTEIEDYETALGLPQEEEAEPEKSVSIFVNRDGNKVNLTSLVEGFDGYELRYQWECDKHDGAGFQDVNGANGSTYSVEATSETLKWEWRLSVYF